jgi:Tfp pilus assembly protein PilN
VIRQFDVVSNPEVRTRSQVPYLTVLQSHWLDGLDTVVVVPLMLPTIVPPDEVVALTVSVNGQTLSLNVPLLSNAKLSRLGRAVANLGIAEDRIRRAIERIFTGF